MRVRDVMTRDVAVVSPYTTVRDAARKMDQLNVGALPVCDGRRLVGIVTDRDITVRCTAFGGPPENTRIHEIMTDDIRWCFEDETVEEIEDEMAAVQIRRLPVVDRHKNLVGIVALGDLATERAPGTEETLRRISEPSEPDRPTPSASRRGEWRPAYREADRDLSYSSEARSHAGRSHLAQAWSPEGGEPARGTRRAGGRFARSWTEPALAGADEISYGASGADLSEGYEQGFGSDDPLGLSGGRPTEPRPSRLRPASYRPAYALPSGRYVESRRQGGDRPIFDRAAEGGTLRRMEDYRGRGPRAYVRSDERMEEDLNESLLEDPELDATDIETEVKDGEVTLAGTVSNRQDKRRAEDIAESLSGVLHVQNNLRVRQASATGKKIGRRKSE